MADGMVLDVVALYECHASNLRGFVVNRLRTDDDERIDDLCADVWARVWARRHQYRDRGHDPKSWLFQIAHREIVDEYRRMGVRKRFVPVPLDMVDAWKATLDAGCDRHVEAISDRATVAGLLAIGWLTDEQRRVVECRFLRGLTERETALATGLGYAGVKKLQARALANLRKYLGVAA